MKYPYLVPKLSRLAEMPNSSAAKSLKSYRFLKTNFLTYIFQSSVLLLTFSIGVVGATLFDVGLGIAIAETPNSLERISQGEKTISQVNVLFVNPSAGDDTAGSGSERAPFRTITRALQVAAPNTTINLVRGTYSTQTGEVFPLILNSGITITGDSASKGRDIVIQGGDDYLSRSYGKQNVAIVGLNQASLMGVTVTNPNRRGYGMWIESSNAVVTDNTFAGNTQDGISITGDAAPTISKNYFYRNGANGLTVSGNARPSVKENVFQQTGFGINIAQNAQPIVANNQIQYNRAGIIVQANARPKLRSNSIQANREDGLVVIGQAIPDLGSAAEPGDNEFRNNARYDINAGASKQVFSAVGNSIASNRIAGRVDMSGNSTPVAQSQQQSTTTGQVITSDNAITFTAPTSPANAINPNRPVTPIPRNPVALNSPGRLPQPPIAVNPSTVSNGLNRQLMPLQAANSLLNAVQTPQPQAAPNRNRPANGFPTPSSLPTQLLGNTTDTPQINYVRVNPGTIEFSAPQSSPGQVANNTLRPQPLQQIETVPPSPLNMSSVPAPYNTAMGNPGAMPMPQNFRPMPNNAPSLIASTDTRIATASTAIRYRVIVPAATERDEQVVRVLAPGAFRTVWRGQGVIQVGVFSNTFNAEQMLQILNSNGLRGMIEPLN